MTYGAPCPECGTEVVKIKLETLNQMLELFRPRVPSVSKGQIKGKRAYIPICLQCDAYALGIDFETGFPFILKDGQESNLAHIADMLRSNFRM